MASNLFGGQGLPASPDEIARARRRVVVLEYAGLSRRTIAARAGVAPSSITKLMNDRPPQLTRSVATKLIAVTAR